MGSLGGSSQAHGALLSRLLWPTAILFVSTFALVVLTFVLTTRDADQVAAAAERQRATAAVRALLDEDAGAFATSLGAAAAPRRMPFDAAVVVRPDGRREAVEPWPLPNAAILSDMHALIEAVLPRRPWAPPGEFALRSTGSDEQGSAQLVVEDGSLFVVASRPAPTGTGTAIAWRRLGPAEIFGLGAARGLEGLHLVPPGSLDDSVISVAGLDGGTAASLAWTGQAPGAVAQRRLAPLVVAGLTGTVLLFGAVVGYFLWTTRHLAEADAVSKAMLGRDPLSGLPNRALFNDRLDGELAAIAAGGPGLAVLFIDLDRFKDVNDTFGHQAGDELIRLVAERLEAKLPEVDTLARFGGDEFAIIQTGVRDAADVARLCGRIQEGLGRPFKLQHGPVTIGTSIGVALAPAHASDRHGLLKLADTALYQAKNGGRNRTSFFQAHMDETIRMRKIVEDDLRAAIEGDGLVLHYQPVLSADGSTIRGVEALVRWPHPTRGLISPAEFIPIAEERGLVTPLGEWVLRRACLDGRRWPGLRVAVNVSPIQFRHRTFVETVMRVLDETGFEPSRLELELTEGVVVDDADAAEAAMVDLRSRGVNLALDDFGTGYSSLIYLRRFAFDTIKIDRSFLESMEATGESAILVHSIVHLGRALGLVVTAEGVETAEQHRFLQALGCHQVQGYLFSPPVPAEAIDRMLRPAARVAVTAA